MTRRSFLGRAALGGATVVVAGTGALAYRSYDQGLFAPERGGAFDAWRDWRTITGSQAAVAAAVLAASPHNTQPWLFGLATDRIDLYADPTRSMGAGDPFDRERDVGLGCALENLCLAARAEGFEPRVSIADQSDPSLVARVRLSPAAARSDELYRAIPERHSDRSAYTASPVPAELQEEMSALSDVTTAPAQLRWMSSDPERTRFGSLMIDATQAFIADDQQSRDAHAWFRSSWDEIQRHKDGLTLDAQGLPRLTLALAKLLPATGRGAGDQFWLDRTRDVHVPTAAAFGLITVPDPQDVAQRVAGGRLLQRVHLWTAAHGLAFQHMNQPTERVDREADLGLDPVTAATLDDLIGEPVLGSFRIGYPTGTPRPSPRRPVEEVLR